ncbi:conserved hypothetical protein [Thermus scotoductus SA-01]|uniref:Uncharacterized protein n=1 Tax=Thermus scotoductus (strain ATCC 700910 / SA-01) TaxID=743525 RepID=E8PKP8_THESS|nr:DUF5317 domain-containing protein [Thermus scotoductus]ADW22200.1 conserved hypothetical protein [Thermus scotoductus SA-01]
MKKKLPRLEHPWLLLLTPTPEILGAFLNLPTALTQSLTYLLVGVAAWANRHLPGIYLVLTGALLNALAVFLHGGMPVDPDALNRAGLERYRDYLAQKGDGFHYLAPAFPLGDWIPLPGRVLSPGDLAIALGLLLTPLLQPKRENLR